MRRSWAFVAFAGLLLPALAVAGESRLFVSRGAEADRVGPRGVGVVRARAVGFDATALPGADGVSPLPTGGHTLLLNLFDDVVLRARLVRAERIEKGMAWVGRLEGQPLSDVVLTVYDGILTGSVTWPDASYRIAVEGGVTVVQQLDHSQFPEDGCFREVPGGARRRGGGARGRRPTTARSSTCWSSTRRRRDARGGRDVADPGDHQHRHRRDEHRLREQRRRPAPAPRGRGGGRLHRERRHRGRPRPHHGHERRLHRQRPHPAQHLQGRHGVSPHRDAGEPVLRDRLADGGQQPWLRAERVQRGGARLRHRLLQLRPRAGPQHGPQPRPHGPRRHGRLRVLLRLQVDRLPDRHGLRAGHPHPLLLEPERARTAATPPASARRAAAPPTTR